jgi:hypothetical protein
MAARPATIETGGQGVGHFAVEGGFAQDPEVGPLTLADAGFAHGDDPLKNALNARDRGVTALP